MEKGMWNCAFVQLPFYLEACASRCFSDSNTIITRRQLPALLIRIILTKTIGHNLNHSQVCSASLPFINL